ncbi:ABC transporter ATP-binding protein [Nodularia sphaerocarpa]|uniref:ABC transporter ATP-binding protein n=1 Tax=Nodularia sphaerocarpa TaxID=137816 RepID=UPI001EFA9A43|nr:ABC transporter ATP-binding protein [Nodularia sphaerocarpa]MDB9371945.1 ABC transporter ATP-binding protein [Nodularia sphaerocarpa CS-585]MDB9378517.1 ABC transporter ATP-binding protein [Nodularia sphaerocarpa CS-585A2]ULP70767.1 Lipid A export ATP-binding/permease protein MsbA [Nodularia sphaerocarpa UHCC 0038]
MSIVKLIRTLQRAIQLVWQCSPLWTFFSVIFLFIQGLLPLLSLYLVKLIVDTLSKSISTTDPLQTFRQLLILIFIAGFVALVQNICQSLSGLTNTAQSQIVIDYIHEQLHNKSIAVDLEYYENSQYYNALHRAQQQASYIPTRILQNLVQIAQSAISLVAMGVLLISLHWGIGLILLITAIPILLVRIKYAGKTFEQQKLLTSKEREAAYFNFMLTSLHYAKELRLLGLGNLFRTRFQKLRHHIRQEKLKLEIQRSLKQIIAQGGTTLVIFALLAVMAYQTLQGAITLGSLIMYYQAFQRGQVSLSQLLSSLAELYENSLFLTNLFEFLDLKPNVTEPPLPKLVPSQFKTGIQFNHVRFRYPGSTRPVLEDINFHIAPGEIIALVGENGAGKTSLIKLLCRLYDPTEGNITIDGINIRDFATTDLRQKISVIFQDYVQYHLTAKENIWLGNLDVVPESQQIEKAARDAGADVVISQLPQGYDTMLGKWFEGGEELSIGQWQKVALARAFLRDAPIIILDEPSSALDPQAEAEIFEKFRQVVKGKIAILISHRLSTVKMADKVFVIANGKISEGGSHDELMQNRGNYARLFETQAKHYR